MSDRSGDARIVDAGSDAQIARCFPVMHQLRPHLEESAFVARVRLQEAEGYRLAFVEEEGAVVAVAGYRILENLAAGRVLYVDDLVTDAAHRSRGQGARLLAWLADRARGAGCAKLELDSGVWRTEAHRFYHAQGLTTLAYHFRLDL